MRWMTVVEWEDKGGRELEAPTTYVYAMHPEEGGLRVLAYWCHIEKEWVCWDDDYPVERGGFTVTHVLEVTDPEEV